MNTDGRHDDAEELECCAGTSRPQAPHGPAIADPRTPDRLVTTYSRGADMLRFY
jgi:hypothetical protein